VKGPHRLTCHCGAIELRIESDIDPTEASRCDCSFCVRRGAIAVRVRRDSVHIEKGADKLTLYQWNTNSAEHYFCSVCGNYTHHRTRANPQLIGLNFGAIDGCDASALRNVPWTDGRNHPSDRAG
jgi:hypothetical protein